MAKEGRIVRHTRAKVAAMISSGDIPMNLRGAREISDEELGGIIPLSSKAPVTLRVDPDIVEFFRKDGPGYETRMNAVLRVHLDENTKRGNIRR